LRRAHARFVVVVLVCVAGVVVSYPRLGDRPRTTALRELAEVSDALEAHALSRKLARDAEQTRAPALGQLVRLVDARRLTAPRGTEPLAHLFVADPPELLSLEALLRFSRPGAEVSVHGPNLDALSDSLRFRIERLAERGRLVLTGLRLSHPVSRERVELEARVAQARVSAKNALASYEQARDKYYASRDRSELLALQRFSKRAMLPALRERVAAYEELERLKPVMQAEKQRYDALAKDAIHQKLEKAPAAGAEGVVVVATLQTEQGARIELAIPVRRSTQRVAAAAFRAPQALAQLESNPLWPQIRALGPEAATERIERGLSWHLRSTELFGQRVSGTTVLQLVPLALAFVAWLLTRRCRVVLRTYSPFLHPGKDLPTPGTGKLPLDRALLIAPPVVVVILTCWALLRLNEEPWIAVMLCAAFVVQGVIAAHSWKAIHDVLAVVQHTSAMPTLPENGACPVHDHPDGRPA
jgi:hypothetical protein